MWCQVGGRVVKIDIVCVHDKVSRQINSSACSTGLAYISRRLEKMRLASVALRLIKCCCPAVVALVVNLFTLLK
jgi:hypothetical protein